MTINAPVDAYKLCRQRTLLAVRDFLVQSGLVTGVMVDEDGMVYCIYLGRCHRPVPRNRGVLSYFLEITLFRDLVTLDARCILGTHTQAGVRSTVDLRDPKSFDGLLAFIEENGPGNA